MAKIRAYAGNHLNAMSTNCYAFTVEPIGKQHMDGTKNTKIDFSGGQDWSKNIVDDDMDYIIMNDTKEVFRINYT